MQIADVVRTLRTAQKVSTPLASVDVPDQRAFLDYARENWNGSRPLVTHDIVNGLRALNDAGTDLLETILQPEDPDNPLVDTRKRDVDEALKCAAENFGKGTVLFLQNAQFALDEPRVKQAILNIRDEFKQNSRMLVLLGPALKLPVELQGMILSLEEDLPGEDELKSIVAGEIENVQAKIPELAPDDTTKIRAVQALRGMAHFPAENAVALALAMEDGKRLLPTSLWERKIAAVNQTPGLRMEIPKLKFADVGGNENAKNFFRCLMAGPNPVRLFVIMDEIEKMLSGGLNATGDSSGTSQDQIAALLTFMERYRMTGKISAGPGGCAKTLLAQAAAGEYGIPLVWWDAGAMKGSLVGQSEAQNRACLKVILALAGEAGAFFIGTCNRDSVLTPELKRRFTYGFWYYDLPKREEREQIFPIHIKKYGLEARMGEVPAMLDRPFTGADIRNVCELSWRMNVTLEEASRFIVPIAISDGAMIEGLRTKAEGRWISASMPGAYTRKTSDTTGKRAVDL